MTESGIDHMTPLMSWLGGLLSRDRRSAIRQAPRHLVAYYWDGATPLAHVIRDISSTGLYLVTEQRWYPGTLVMITLQRADAADTDPYRSIIVKTKVVRLGTDGVGLAFVIPEKREQNPARGALPGGSDRKTFQRFLNRLGQNQGQALIEYVLVLPIVLLLVVNVVNFGGFFYAWITVANAARAGADYAILAGASVGAPGQTTAAQVNSLITTDVSSLPNSASLAVNICENINGTITNLVNTKVSCSFTPPSDPESASYDLVAIDVTYTYIPFIPATFKFPSLNVYATIPPTTVHRLAVMRVIQ
jgi:Flp pilus assembly protein TadG